MNLCRGGRRVDEFLSIGHIRIENGNFSGDFSQIFHHNFNDFLQALFKLTKKTIRKDSHKPQGGTKIHQIYSQILILKICPMYFL